MEEQCRICEKFFTVEDIKNGTPVPTFRNQHYRLILIDEIVHQFRSIPKKKMKFIGEAI